MLVDVARRRVDRILSNVSDSVMVVTEELQRYTWTRLGSGLPLRRGDAVGVDVALSLVGGAATAFLSDTDGCADFTVGFPFWGRPRPFLLARFLSGVTSLTIAEAASPADLAEVVSVDVTSLADAGMVTIGVADLADAGMAFPADPAGVVTVGVASLADAGMVTVAVTDLADAGAASLADAGMALPADPAGVVTIGVASLADAEMVFLADLAGVVTRLMSP